MPLTPGESDRLLLHLEASLAQRRRDRGLQLNVPEARALLADAICEWARDGKSLAEVRDLAHGFLTLEDHTDVYYQIDRMFEPGHGQGVRWNDPAFAIVWPDTPRLMSDRDAGYPDHRVS